MEIRVLMMELEYIHHYQNVSVPKSKEEILISYSNISVSWI